MSTGPIGAAPAGPVTSLDIVIVNWNTGPYLRACLESVAGASQTGYALERVIVVDNSSTDDSLDLIDDVVLPLTVVRSSVNLGFAAACNRGAAQGDADLLLFLNPDTQLFPDTLERTVAFMVDPENAGIGICGGRMIDPDGGEELSCARFPTLWMFVAKMTGLAHGFPRWVPRQRMTAAELGGNGIVDQVIGAFFLMRRELFTALDGFDERFFVYLEDVDIALRARDLGYASYFLADVPIRHTGRVSSEQVRGKRLFYLLRSRTEYARKHWPRWQGSVLASLILLIELPVRLVLAVLPGQQDSIKDVGEAAGRYAGYILRGHDGRAGDASIVR